MFLSTCVNVGLAARAFVVLNTPPSFTVVSPYTQHNILLGLPGSMTISFILLLPVPGLSRLPNVVTVSFLKVTAPAAAVALVDLYSPTKAVGGTEDEGVTPGFPATPVEVDTKMLAGFVGSTSILLIDLKVNVPVVTEPPPERAVKVCGGSMGPTNDGVASALSILYKPTPA